MELSKRTQTIIALVSGVLLGAVLVATAMQSYYKAQINQIVSERTGQTSQTKQAASEPASPNKSENEQKIASTATTASDQAVTTEQPTQTAETPATEQETSTAPQQSEPPAQTNEQKDQPTATQAATAVSAYTYTAKSGDSYSVLARKAVQTYGLKNKVTLSPAQIIAAEAFLTAQAGSPELNEGQQVDITIDSVKSAVDSAQKLSPDEQALWDVYAQDVEFNTDRNG